MTYPKVSKNERLRDGAHADDRARRDADAGMRVALDPAMKVHSIAMALTLALGGGGCVTTTAHQLVLTDNPLRDQAMACEQKCQPRRVPARKPCEQAFGGDDCTVSSGGEDDYAACLDGCPGSRAKDGASCPDPPVPGVICVETTRANAGGIAGGAVGAAGIIGGILIVSAIVTSPLWLVIILAN